MSGIINTIQRSVIILACVAMGVSAMAQTNSGSQSSSSIVRRSEGQGRGGRNQQASPDGVTQRMEQFYQQQPASDADLQWMRVIYRQIDLDKDKNAPLYYPEDELEGQQNLFRVMMKLLAQNTVPAYEYLDGREIFTDAYRVQPREVLDRFHIMYTDAKGSTERNPRFEIDPSDVPTNEVLSYYIIERWEFDARQNRMRTRVEAICPVLHRSGDFGGEAVKYPMFWMKMQDIRPYIAQQQIFISDDNNLPTCTLDDYFAMNLYEGDIYKTRNLKNRSMAQLYPDPDDLRRAQDSIQNRLTTFENSLWVPTREEVIAAREAREALEAGIDSAAVEQSDADKPKTSRNRRVSNSQRKPAKQSKVKQSKPKTTSSSANRSVRRRKK